MRILPYLKDNIGNHAGQGHSYSCCSNAMPSIHRNKPATSMGGGVDLSHNLWQYIVMRLITLTILCMLLALSLTACPGDKEKEVATEEEPPSSREIVDNYTNNLTTGRSQAEKAVQIGNDRLQQQQDIINDLEK